MLYNWWIQPENWAEVSALPHFNTQTFPLNVLLPKRRYQEVLAQFDKVGSEEVYRQVECLYKSLSDCLGDSEYFFGDSPSTLDAIVFGHLAIHLVAKLESPQLRALLLQQKNLAEYCKRILKGLFDYDTDSIIPPALPTKEEEDEDKESQLKTTGFAKYGIVLGIVGVVVALRYFASWNAQGTEQLQNNG